MHSLTYICHSCFALEGDDFIIVFDFWTDTPDGRLKSILADGAKQIYFLSSHFHADHFNKSILRLGGEMPRCQFLLSHDIVRKHKLQQNEKVLDLMAGNEYETEHFKLRAFRSTDIGISSVVELPEGETYFHAGDLNNWYFANEPENINVSVGEMEGIFFSIVRSIGALYPEIDHAMFPVDLRLGKDALRGPCQWLQQIDTKNFYPMHFWGRFDELNAQLKQIEDLFCGTKFHYPEPGFYPTLD